MGRMAHWRPRGLGLTGRKVTAGDSGGEQLVALRLDHERSLGSLGRLCVTSPSIPNKPGMQNCLGPQESLTQWVTV